MIDELFGNTTNITRYSRPIPADGYETPKKRKALKQSKLRVQGPKIKLFADHDSDMSTGTSKKSAMKMTKALSRKTTSRKKKLAHWLDSDRKAKSNAASVIKQLYSHEKIYSGDSLIRL